MDLSLSRIEHGTLIKINRGEIIKRKGDLTDQCFLVKKGLLRSFFLDDNGKEHIFIFASENVLIGDVFSGYGTHTSEFTIDAIEDSEVEVYDKDFFVNEFIHNYIVRLSPTDIHEKYIAAHNKRLIMLLSKSAWERYQDFIKTHPLVAKRIPQRMIASYLGVTPGALSRLKRLHSYRERKNQTT